MYRHLCPILTGLPANSVSKSLGLNYYVPLYLIRYFQGVKRTLQHDCQVKPMFDWKLVPTSGCRT